jgi:hypothetical protein
MNRDIRFGSSSSSSSTGLRPGGGGGGVGAGIVLDTGHGPAPSWAQSLLGELHSELSLWLYGVHTYIRVLHTYLYSSSSSSSSSSSMLLLPSP